MKVIEISLILKMPDEGDDKNYKYINPVFQFYHGLR